MIYACGDNDSAIPHVPRHSELTAPLVELFRKPHGETGYKAEINSTNSEKEEGEKEEGKEEHPVLS